MDGWRLYGMSMIFHVFLGVFFGTMWEDDEVSGMCSSCDLEIGVFTYKKTCIFGHGQGKSWRAHVGTNQLVKLCHVE